MQDELDKDKGQGFDKNKGGVEIICPELGILPPSHRTQGYLPRQ